MKEKRQCSNNINYPVYQQPIMVPPMGYPMYQGGFQPNMMGMSNMNSGITNNTFEQQINNIEQQINLLDQRITRLEGLNNNMNNKYNDSNYYMV
jgi:hypothetical protein